MVRTVILAAGGSSPSSKNKPKCLLEIRGKKVIENQVSILKSLGIKDINVVIGYDPKVWNKKNREIIEKLIDKNKITVNKNSKRTQSPHSLKLALKNNPKNEPILVIDGDLIFNSEVIKSLLDMSHNNSSLLITEYLGRSGSYVNFSSIGKDGYIVNDIGDGFLSDYIYSGIALFSKKDVVILKKILETGKYSNLKIAKLFSDMLKFTKLYCIKLKEKPKDLFIEIKDMAGGSFCKTSKLFRKKDGYVLRKEVVMKGEEKLMDECKWLMNLPENISKHFPKVSNYHCNETPTYFETKFYDMPSLRTMLLSGKMSVKEALKLLENIFDFLFENLYTMNITRNVKDYVFQTHLKRVYTRLIEMKTNIKVFNDIVDKKILKINGKKYYNILYILGILKDDEKFMKSVTPKQLNAIHGDLHFDNILFDKNNFVLVDPRGCSEGDITYDIGKIWHSCNGMYDFLHTGQFVLEKKNGAFRLYIKNKKGVKLYREIRDELAKILTKYEYAKKDKNWLKRVLFSEAMHFCSVVPFHLKYDGVEKLALALYLTGVILLNEVYSHTMIKEKVIDVGVKEEYEKAKKVVL